MKYSSFSKKNSKPGKRTGRYAHMQREKQEQTPEAKSQAAQNENPSLKRQPSSRSIGEVRKKEDSLNAPLESFQDAAAASGPKKPEGAIEPAGETVISEGAFEEAKGSAPDQNADEFSNAAEETDNNPSSGAAMNAVQAAHEQNADQSHDSAGTAHFSESEDSPRRALKDSSPASPSANDALRPDTQDATLNKSLYPSSENNTVEQSDEADMVDMAGQRGRRPRRKKSRTISAKENLIFLTACIAIIAAILIVSIKDSSRTIDASPGFSSGQTLSSLTPPGAWANPTPTGPPLISEPSGMIIMDNSINAKQIIVEEKRINRPAVYGSELLFSAGNGSIEKPVLTTLYLFDVTTQKYTKIATTQIEDGEIFEYFISDKWIIWLDTDHKGTNIIYKLNRQNNQISKVREVGNLRPKLSLYGDLLAWMEQIDEESDRLYLLELNSEEDIVIEEFHQTAYALSAPYIYENTVIWVGEDPSGSGESAIFRADFTMDGNYNPEDQEQGTNASGPPQHSSSPGSTVSPNTPSGATPTPSLSPSAPVGPWQVLPSSSENDTLKVYYYPAGMYVHEPMYNGEVMIWIDKNKAPDSSLYMLDLASGEVSMLQTGVTSYALGTDFVVINSNQEIWAYYYGANTLMRVSSADRASILPETQGRVVVWEDKSSSGSGDVFMYNILG